MSEVRNKNKKKYLIIGGGAQAKYVIDTLSIYGEKVEGILDIENNENYHGTRIGSVKVLGYYKEFIDNFDPKSYYLVLCHSDNKLKEKVFYELIKAGYRFPKIVHPTAYISRSVEIEDGCIINSNVSIMPFAKIGKCVVVHSNSVIEHDCIIEDFVNIAPSVTIAGYVKVGKRSYIYSNATLIPGVKVGSDVVVGAGAVVIDDVENGRVVKGVPAR